jgi:ABC-type lipoprotein release transport system permease subunit
MSQRKPLNAWALYTFLSSRLNQGRGFGSFVKGTAVLGILVGATALWITLSVVRGFSTVISDKTVEFAPELTISLASGETFTRSDTLLQRIETVVKDRWANTPTQDSTQVSSSYSLSVMLDEQVMIQHHEQVTGGLLRGIQKVQFEPLRPFVESDVCGEAPWQDTNMGHTSESATSHARMAWARSRTRVRYCHGTIRSSIEA